MILWTIYRFIRYSPRLFASVLFANVNAFLLGREKYGWLARPTHTNLRLCSQLEQTSKDLRITRIKYEGGVHREGRRKKDETRGETWGRLYPYSIPQVSQNTPQNTKHSLYTFCISINFRVSLMPRKNTIKHFDISHECQPQHKIVQNVKKVTWNTLLYTFRFSHFANVFTYFEISV